MDLRVMMKKILNSIIETSTATEEESSLILKYLGLAIMRHQTAINENSTG